MLIRNKVTPTAVINLYGDIMYIIMIILLEMILVTPLLKA